MKDRSPRLPGVSRCELRPRAPVFQPAAFMATRLATPVSTTSIIADLARSAMISSEWPAAHARAEPGR